MGGPWDDIKPRLWRLSLGSLSVAVIVAALFSFMTRDSLAELVATTCTTMISAILIAGIISTFRASETDERKSRLKAFAPYGIVAIELAILAAGAASL